MAGIPLQSLLDHLRRLHGHADAARRSDRELLHAFAANHDEEAFAEVVRRHATLIWGVCRRILGHQQDAEDAFQATFVILARRAGSTPWRSSVAGWLHTVAQRLAVRARQQVEQRRLHEQAASRTPPHQESLRELAAVDEELQRLPAKYREPLLLHYWQGMTAEAAARQLGLSRSSFYNRLAYGRELLRERLSRQGLSLAAPLLIAALTAEAEAAAPSLMQATLRGVMGSVPERVAVLAAQAMGVTTVLKLKIGVALVLLLGMAVGGVAMWSPQTSKPPVPKAERPAAPPKADEKSARRVDRYGDPLPEGAVARLGTLRFRVDADEVDHVAFAPDGKTVAVASSKFESSNGLSLIDAVSGKQKKLIPPPKHSISFGGGIFSKDGKRLITQAMIRAPGSQKQLLQVWDVDSGQKISECAVGLASILWYGYTAEGQPLAACLGKEEIILHETGSGRKRHFSAKDLPDPMSGFPCWCIAGKSLLVASNDKGVVHLWDITSGQERCRLQSKGVLVHNPVLSPDERWLATLSGDADKVAVQLWEARTGKATHTVAVDQPLAESAVFSPDGKTLATISRMEVRFWDPVSGRERGRLKKESRSFQPSAVSFAPDGKTLATAERGGVAIQLWDVATGERKPGPEGHSTSWLRRVSFSPDGKRVVSLGSRAIRVWDASTGRPLAQIRRASSHWLAGCAFSGDGRTLLSSWNDVGLLLFDANTARELYVLKPSEQRGSVAMYLSGDRRKVIAFTMDLRMTAWDTTTRKQLFQRRIASLAGPTWIAVSADADLLALPHAERGGSRQGRSVGMGPMYLEKLQTGERLLTFPSLKGQTWPLAFSPDGRLLISNTIGTLRLWEVLTASELRTLPSVVDNPKVAFSPDGRVLATITPSGEILLWDVRRGKDLRRFKGFDARVASLAFSPDGRRLVSGLSNSTSIVWDVGAPTAAPIHQPGAEGAAKAWADLARSDAARAFRARGALASAPAEATNLLSERLHAAKSADPPRLRRLLSDLESAQFAVREKAQEELAKLGDLTEPALRKTLASKPTLEVRRRVQTLLERLRGPVTQPELLQALRAVAVLEDIGTPPARRLLDQLANGAPEARLSREAKAALWRLGLRGPSKD